jgi:hypothetical protein
VRVRPDIEELGRKRAARDIQIIAALSQLRSRDNRRTNSSGSPKSLPTPGTVNFGNHVLKFI